MDLLGVSLIGGSAAAERGRAFHGTDPATRERLEPPFHDATAAVADRAAELAELAFEPFRRTRPDERAAFLRAIADELTALGDELLVRAHAETGLPLPRLTGERERTVGQLRLFADVVEEGSWVGARIDRARPDRTPLPKPDLRRMFVPLGPVAVFGASNFPLAFSVAGGDTASAVAAGCPVVFKAHPAHPGTSEMAARALLRAADRAGMPAGVFSLLHGSGHEIGLHLVRHPLIQAVGFTGSLRAGRALFDAAAARPRPIPVYAEMGSINPVFLLPSALELRGAEIAAGLLQSMTMGVGQFCTNPGLVVGLRARGLQPFQAELAERLRAAPAGTMLYPALAEGYRRGVEALRGAVGVELLAESAAATAPDSASCRPILFGTDVRTFREQPRLHEETFGPCSLVVAAGGDEELLEVARSLEGQLTATVHGSPDDLVEHAELLRILERKAGRLIFNSFPTGVEVGHAMHHGGPYPATTDSRSTSVGSAAIERFARPVAYQDFPDSALPPELRDSNPRGIARLVEGRMER